MKRFTYTVLVTALLTATSMVSDAAPRTEIRNYIGGEASYWTQPCTSGYLQSAGVCVATASGDSSVSITIADVTGKTIPTKYTWYRYYCTTGYGGGCYYELLTSGVFCGSVSGLSIPSTANRLQIQVSALMGDCTDEGFATTGRATLVWA